MRAIQLASKDDSAKVGNFCGVHPPPVPQLTDDAGGTLLSHMHDGVHHGLGSLGEVFKFEHTRRSVKANTSPLKQHRHCHVLFPSSIEKKIQD